MELWLAIRRGEKVVEAAVLSWSRKCWKTILPKRSPDRDKGGEQIWVVAPERRRAFGTHANKMLERFNKSNLNNHGKEELYGFFTLVGIGSRWANDRTVDWCLVLCDRELALGDVL